ncbi:MULTISPECIES: DUF4760 domain-containing protein [Rhodopseudomonas]|uniref:DUF4760 domain-containing protein n=1 Tax=Rhodopseudomonas TaxID=1073 RepID=UPI0011C01DCB|nr:MULTISPECIES: hypothetical protein [Rhodopseudomonas]
MALTAIGTNVLVIATLILAFVAGYQISEARRETRTNRTMEIIARYEECPVLERCLRRMARARDKGDLATNVKAYRLDIVALLNYLESMAMGMEQGLYIKALIEDYMEPIISFHVEETITLKLLDGLEAKPEDFQHLFELKKRWDDAKLRKEEEAKRQASRLKFNGRAS